MKNARYGFEERTICPKCSAALFTWNDGEGVWGPCQRCGYRHKPTRADVMEAIGFLPRESERSLATSYLLLAERGDGEKW